MTSIFQAGQPFNIVRTSSTTYQANDKDLVISSGDEVALPSPNQGATILVRPAPSIGSVKITTSNGTIGNTGETFGIYRATEPIYLVGDGTDWYARSGGDEISAIPDSAISRYTFDNADTESGTAKDIWGNNDGTISGPTTGVSGANQTYNTNEAYDFDGSNDSVELPTSILSDGDYSIAFWINPDSVNDGDDDTVIQLRAERDILIQESGGTLQNLFIGNIDSISSNTWYHIVTTYDDSATDWTAYVDGSETNTVSTDVPTRNDSSITIGVEENDTDYFDGVIDDVRIYSKPLSATEVSNLYNNGFI